MTDFAITGFNAQSEVAFPTVTVPKQSEVLLKGVSFLVVRFHISYLQNGVEVGTGDFDVVVTAGGTVTIIDPPFVSTEAPVRLEVSPATASIAIGAPQQFTATAFLASGDSFDASSQVVWSSDASSVASVDEQGQATGLAAGTAKITATLNDLSASADLTVTPGTTPGNVASIEIFPKSVYAPFDSTRRYTAILTLLDGNKVDGTNSVTWSLSDNTLGTINSTGSLTTLLAPGSGNVIATQDSVSGTSPLTVGPSLLSLCQVTDQSLATFIFDGTDLSLVGNVSLPAPPLRHVLSRNNLDAFVALDTGLQYCRLDTTSRLYQTTSFLSNSNLTSVTGMFVKPSGDHVYCWDANNRRFLSVSLDGSAMNIESIVSLNTTDDFGISICGLQVQNQTFVQFTDLTTNTIGQIDVSNLDDDNETGTQFKDINYLADTTYTDDDNDVFLDTSVAPVVFSSSPNLACSDNNLFAATQSPFQIFTFNVLADGTVQTAASPLDVTNASFPIGFNVDPTGHFLPAVFFRSSAQFLGIFLFQGGSMANLLEQNLTTTFFFDFEVDKSNLFAVGSGPTGVVLNAFSINQTLSTLTPLSGVNIDPAPCSQRITH